VDTGEQRDLLPRQLESLHTNDSDGILGQSLLLLPLWFNAKPRYELDHLLIVGAEKVTHSYSLDSVFTCLVLVSLKNDRLTIKLRNLIRNLGENPTFVVAIAL